MAEILDEIEIRDRNVVTIPLNVRSILNVGIGDWLRWVQEDDGSICIYKIVTKIVNSGSKNIGGGVSGAKDV